jgi:heme a synthase
VTASGPHAGDPGTPRLGLDIRTIAVAHADAVWALVALTLATWLVARALGATRVARAAAIALAVELAQGGVGYLQYALGIPPELVSLHLLGAALVWVAVLRVAFATVHVPATTPDAEPDVVPATATSGA